MRRARRLTGHRCRTRGSRPILLIHPLVVGSGRRLFREATPARLRLVSTVTTATGVIVVTYQAVPSGGQTREVAGHDAVSA